MKKLFKYRYIVVALIFCVTVAFGLSGSSVGLWAGLLGGEDNGVIFGVSRPIRSDEWAVSTPMLFSQYYDAAGSFSYFNSAVRGEATDVFLEYGQPVKSIFMIFRPFYLGYLFLPIANGMAFFWFGRLLVLLCVSFEFARIVTKDDKLLSAVYSMAVSLSPAVQWWFAVNGLVEMLICIQLAVVLVHYYLQEERGGKRILYIFLLFWLAGVYILTMYPAWQIPLGYCLFGLLLWQILERKEKIFQSGKEILCFVCAALLVAFFLGSVFSLSKESILALMNTEYPGKRVETGGGALRNLFNYVSNIWYAKKDEAPYANTCEAAGFIDLFPLSLFLPLYGMVRSKKKDILCIVLSVVSLFLGLWCISGFTEGLAKITFLSYSPANRTIAAFGFCNLILLFRGISILCSCGKEELGSGLVSELLCFVALGTAYFINPDYYSEKMIVCTVVLFLSLFFGATKCRIPAVKVIWSLVMAVMFLLAGARVNPVRCGVEDIENAPVLSMIREIHIQEPEALWVVDSEMIPMINAPLLAGAKTVNSTNVYPDLERWRMFDPDNEYEHIYNRYAHITVIAAEKNSYWNKFEAGAPDAFTVYLEHEDLKALGVKYILSARDTLDQECYSLVDSSSGWSVFEVR